MYKFIKLFLTALPAILLVVLVWAFNPPTTIPPGGSGAISVDSSGNVGINTVIPGAKLDVNGTGIFRGTLDLVSNKIINLADPTVATDVANKRYVDNRTTPWPLQEWGTVNCSGNIQNTGSNNWTVTRLSPGDFRLNFAITHNRGIAVTAIRTNDCSDNSTDKFLTLRNNGTTSTEVIIWDPSSGSSGANLDYSFQFMTVGLN